MSETQSSPVEVTGARSFVRRRPVAAFVALAFALSWGFWLLLYLTSSPVMFFLGALGPAMAAAIVAWQVGTLQPWLGRVLRWRVSPWFYLFAFGFPVLLYGVSNAILAVFGAQPDLSLLGQRLPAYAVTWVAAFFMGGLEEPGWRGFALPRLEQRYTPVRATLLLGVVWGLWHLPVEPLAIVVTVPLAFFYTWLFNRTGSALLCVLLHASITPAQEHLSLVADSPVVDLTIGVTLIAAAIGFVVATRGRLGLPDGGIGNDPAVPAGPPVTDNQRSRS
ncbi:MAG TPA: type II CAAX endopeptidase family protein [Euzebyales bacterium]|nr:type II CAAX endopeptidase family protein [Euzebyales bacterium]